MSVILINPFEVPKGKEEKCLKMWDESAEYLKNMPGFINTSLHEAIVDDAKFHFINVAEWESPESFFSAVGTEVFQKITKDSMEMYPHYPSLYKVIRKI